MEEAFPLQVPQKYSYYHSLVFTWKSKHHNFTITFTKSTTDQWHIFLISLFHMKLLNNASVYPNA